MTFVKHKSTIRAIRQGEADFTLVDGFAIYPRAMAHILPQCPPDVRDMVNFALAKGYLQLVSHVHDNELMWEKLSHD
jgi:hypothetical protein